MKNNLCIFCLDGDKVYNGAYEWACDTCEMNGDDRDTPLGPDKMEDNSLSLYEEDGKTYWHPMKPANATWLEEAKRVAKSVKPYAAQKATLKTEPEPDVGQAKPSIPQNQKLFISSTQASKNAVVVRYFNNGPIKRRLIRGAIATQSNSDGVWLEFTIQPSGRITKFYRTFNTGPNVKPLNGHVDFAHGIISLVWPKSPPTHHLILDYMPTKKNEKNKFAWAVSVRSGNGFLVTTTSNSVQQAFNTASQRTAAENIKDITQLD